MRVAIFTGTYIKNKDGVARSLYELVHSLRVKGHEVGIWSPEISTQYDEGVKTFPMPSIPVPLYPDYKMTIYFKNVIKELRKFSPDIIQISTPDLIAVKFLKYARIKDIPIISVYHTDFPSYLKYYRLDLLEGAVWRELTKFYNKCNLVFTPTREMKELLESKGVKKVEVWSRGIRKGSFDPSKRSEELRKKWGAKEKTVVLFSGRFVKYKDLDIVVEVYNRFNNKNQKDVKFVMLGSGPMEQELKKKMPDGIFPGYLHGEDLYKSYASGDIFLFPSTTETFGNVVLEAISSGLPSVVSDTGGCREIIQDSGAGIICRAGNVENFTEAVSVLMTDKTKYLGLKMNGLKWSGNRTWEAINRKMIDRLADLVDG